jgi:glyoxylase-like metal-dependent hydrolase (beta-lactamase superfamily II)
MVYNRYFAEQVSDHLFVVGQEPALDGFDITDCHVYLIVGEVHVLAVDAGGGDSWPFVKAVAERYGFADKPVSHVLVTHGHGDHARGLTPFEGQGALTVCSAYTAQHLDSLENADVIFDRDRTLTLGEMTPQALLTPGHTPGCASYRLTVDGKLCLFTGDLVQENGGLGWCGSEGFSQEQVLLSLKRLAAMPTPDWLLTGHSFIVGGMQVIEKAIHYGESGQWIPWTEEAPRMP